MLSLLHLGFSVLWYLIPYTLGNPLPSPNPAPAPLPDGTVGNSYTGSGGSAVGGSVVAAGAANPGILDMITGGKSILSLSSGNAGNGGDATSGNALSHSIGGGALGRVLSTGRKSSKAKNGAGFIGGVVPGAPLDMSNSYSGSGGNAGGGSSSDSGSFLELWSHNAGDGGRAKSGNSRAFRRESLGKNRVDRFEPREISSIPVRSAEDIWPRRPIRVLRSAYQQSGN